MVLVIIDTSKHLLSPRCKNNDIRKETFTLTLIFVSCKLNNYIYLPFSAVWIYFVTRWVWVKFPCPMLLFVHLGASKCLDVSVITRTIQNVAGEGIFQNHVWWFVMGKILQLQFHWIIHILGMGICAGENLSTLDYKHFR